MGLHLLGFGLGTVKFMFAAALMMASAQKIEVDLSYWEVVVTTFLGAWMSFNIFYFSAGFFMERARLKKLEKIKNGTIKIKKQFSRTNKGVVKLKLSPFGYFGLVVVGPMVLSIPIGSIIIAKFYRRLKLTYWLETISLFFWANLFTILNFYIFK